MGMQIDHAFTPIKGAEWQRHKGTEGYPDRPAMYLCACVPLSLRTFYILYLPKSSGFSFSRISCHFLPCSVLSSGSAFKSIWEDFLITSSETKMGAPIRSESARASLGL